MFPALPGAARWRSLSLFVWRVCGGGSFNNCWCRLVVVFVSVFLFDVCLWAMFSAEVVLLTSGCIDG